jgi:NedA-like, galactose-binding domain
MAASKADFVFAFLLAALSLGASNAQVIRVNITPGDATNHFDPRDTLGAGIDRIPTVAIDKMLTKPTLQKVFTSGWQPVSYRLNTELSQEAWHWNPEGTWSSPGKQGYFVGSPKPTGFIRHSFGYKLPRGSASLTDGSISTFWKSNPYLSSRFTGDANSLHPQWVMLDLTQFQRVDSIKIAWAAPYATQYTVQFWTSTADPVGSPTAGVWEAFPHGVVKEGNGGTETIRLADNPIPVRYIRVLMTHSSHTCDQYGPSDPRNCVGFAIRELYLGTTTSDGEFHDVVHHVADPERTMTRASSVDPWHTSLDRGLAASSQVGFDLFYTSGVTQGLPAVIPIAVIYDNPDNAAAEIKYLEARHYPISYVEMGEEADGQAISPEDYAALYLEFATALHKVDPKLKLGGPSFQGVNQDILYWPNAKGEISWFGRFLNYLKAHDRMQDLSFFSFEHYPLDPCHISWGSLYDEPNLITGIVQTWRNDGLPRSVPLLITESNLSSSADENFMDIFGGLWLADYVGSFLNAGGSGIYYFHYLPLQMTDDCNDDSPGTFGMFTVDPDYKIEQPLSQYFASRMINFEWLQRDGMHTVYPASGTYQDGAGHTLVTAYSVLRPDGTWAVMMVNRDQENAHQVQIAFLNDKIKTESYLSGDVHVSTFGRNQYKWRPARTNGTESHFPLSLDVKSGLYIPGYADPDGPIMETTAKGNKTTEYDIPASSIVVVRGTLASR